MPIEDNPTGFAYFKTFQALFQTMELILLLITWAILATQPFFRFPSLVFVVGVLVFIWVITLVYFFIYISGLHTKISGCCTKEERLTEPKKSEPDKHTTESSTSATSSNYNIAWFVSEYIIYFIFSIFLLVCAIIVSANILNHSYLAVMIFGWFTVIVYFVHFCLLVKVTEGVWPYKLVLECWHRLTHPKRVGESTGLLASLPQPNIEHQ